MSKRIFILYDDRAAAPGSNTDDASVLEVCESNEEALEARGDYGGMACYSYDVKKMPDGQTDHLINEQFEWNWFPGNPTKGPWPR